MRQESKRSRYDNSRYGLRPFCFFQFFGLDWSEYSLFFFFLETTSTNAYTSFRKELCVALWHGKGVFQITNWASHFFPGRPWFHMSARVPTKWARIRIFRNAQKSRFIFQSLDQAQVLIGRTDIKKNPIFVMSVDHKTMRTREIEPRPNAWKALILPLYEVYRRLSTQRWNCINVGADVPVAVASMRARNHKKKWNQSR